MGVDNLRGRFCSLSFTNTIISTIPSNKPAITIITMIIVLSEEFDATVSPASALSLHKDNKNVYLFL